MNANQSKGHDEKPEGGPKKKSPKRATKVSISKEELEDTAAMWQDVPLQFGINRPRYTAKERAKHLKNHPEYQAYLKRRNEMLSKSELSRQRRRKWLRRMWIFK